MFWSALFIISAAQGFFVLTLLMLKPTANRAATSLFMTITLIMVITNFDYLITSTPLYHYVPRVFGISFGLRFLVGPVLYFYTLATTDHSFRWKSIYFLHFLPYAVNLAFNVPLFTMNEQYKLIFIDRFIQGSLRYRTIDIVLIVAQNISFFIYIFLSIRWISHIRLSYDKSVYLIGMRNRLAWLRSLMVCFSILLIVIVIVVCYVIAHGRYSLEANKLYTLFMSVFIYFIAYRLVLNPDLISPGFVKKYKAVKPLRNGNTDESLTLLQSLMDEQKLFTNPDLKLTVLAAALDLTPHQLSRLINEKFERSFNELVNEYRVQEFIKRVNDPKYGAFSIYGIAMDVGFSSKSSFNSIVKKNTGKTPSEFKSTNSLKFM